MDLIIVLGVIFTGYQFLKLSQKYKRNPILYLIIGIAIFLVTYYAATVFMMMFLNVGLKFPYSNPTIISCFTIPLAIFVTGISYKIIEGRLKKIDSFIEIANEKTSIESTINQIGNKE